MSKKSFDLEVDGDDYWRWSLKNQTGNVVARSPKRYGLKTDAMSAFRRLLATFDR